VALGEAVDHGHRFDRHLIHSRGLKLWTADDLNLVAPSKTGTYTIDNASNQPTKHFRHQPLHRQERYRQGARLPVRKTADRPGNDAVAVQLRKQVARALSVQASYTWFARDRRM